MTLSKREAVMAVVTLVIVVVGGTLLLGRPLLAKWNSAAAQRQRLIEENRLNARLIRQREDVATRLDAIRGRLPRFTPDQPVTADLLKMIKQLADQHGVALTRMEPEQERQVGDLSEVAINCQWDAALDGITHLLHGVQAQGAILDVRQLTIAPAQSAAGRLKGNFTVFCAFSRSEEEAPPPEAPAAAVEAPAPAAPPAPAPAPAAAAAEEEAP